MIKAIIFDLGNVLFKVSFNEAFKYWSKISGRPIDILRINFGFDDMYRKHEKSKITSNQYFKYLSEKLQIDIPIKEIKKGWNLIYKKEFSGVKKLLIDSKKKYRIVGFTNSNSVHKAVWEKKYSHILEELENIFSSHIIKTRKPELSSYKYVLNYLNLQPEEAVFLDDSEENIVAAKKLGIKGILVKSFKQMEIELRKI